MSHNPALPITGLRPLLQKAAGHLHRTTQRERWFNLGWQWLALVAGLFVIDLLFALPVWARWVALLAQIGFVAWRLAPILRKGAKRKVDAQRTARAVEARFPNSDNAFINAVQFGAAIDSAPETQALLMRREIERAEKMAAGVPAEEAVDRSGEVRSMRKFAGAAGILLLVAVAFSGAFFAVMPRLFAPWMDDVTPPYSLTKIQISPAGAKVRYGDNLVIAVQVSGPFPENLTLTTRTKNGKWQDVALESTEPGKYSVTLEALHEDTTFYAKGGGARSARYVARVVLPPEAQSLHARYTFPTYLKRTPETEVVGDKGLHGVRGTKAEIEVAANRDVSGGELDVTYDDGREEKFALTASPDKPQVARTEMTITGGGEYRIALEGSDGQVNPSAAHGKIVLDAVQGPSVWFVEPEQDILVTPLMHVAVQLDADAEAGVEHVAMHRVINGIADNPEDMFKAAPEKHVESRRMIDLADLGVRPGDTITYYGAAYDATPGAPNFAETEPYTMKVVSEEEYKKTLKEERKSADLAKEVQDILNTTETLAKAQQELAKKMDALNQQLAKNPNNAAAKKAMEAAKAEQAALQKEAEKLAKQLQQYAQSPSASDAESEVKKKVGEMAQQVGKAAQAMQGGQSPNPSQAAQSAAKAAAILKAASATGQQKAGQAVKHMEEVAPLFDDIQRFMDLLDRQGQLVLQARQFQDHNPQSAEERATMQHITDEQRRVAEDLKQLGSDFRTDAAAAAKDFPKAAASAVKIADEIEHRQIVSLMRAGHGEFAQAHGAPGYDDANKALQQMEAMVSTCKGGQGKCEGELDLSLSRSLGKSGLGQSFGQGFGSMPGSGTGSAMGSRPGSRPGQAGGSTSSSAAHAYVMRTQSMHSGGGPKKVKSGNRADTQAELSPDSVEVVKSFATKPPKASDDAAAGYPPEYRKMVNDYFVSVSKEKR